MNIKKRLLEEAEKDYKKFAASLIPNIDNVLGVRLPVLRKLAEEIYKCENWQEFLKIEEFEFMEETMLQGMVIGFVKDKPEKILKLMENFIPKINNWSVCDSFCCGLKFTAKNKELVWNFILPYLNSDKEFEIRFGLVMLLNYYVNNEYIDKIFEITDRFNNEEYYAEMAAAWLVSICYIKFPEKTYEYLKKSNLPDWTFKKCIQKICESTRVDNSSKKKLRALKKL